jgi:amino acid transporter
MKAVSLTCLLVGVVMELLMYVANYAMGWGSTNSLLLAGNSLMGLLVFFLVIVGLLVAVARSLYRREKRFWPTICLVIFVLVVFALPSVFVLPGYMSAYGLRDHMMRDFTLDQLRSFAREVQAGPIGGRSISPYDLSELSDSEKQTVLDLRKKYPFLQWGSHGAVVNSGADFVSLMWGSGFGHWGCYIALDKTEGGPLDLPQVKILRISNDIYFFSGD